MIDFCSMCRLCLSHSICVCSHVLFLFAHSVLLFIGFSFLKIERICIEVPEARPPPPTPWRPGKESRLERLRRLAARQEKEEAREKRAKAARSRAETKESETMSQVSPEIPEVEVRKGPSELVNGREGVAGRVYTMR